MITKTKSVGKSAWWYLGMSLIMFGFIFEFFFHGFGVPTFITSGRISAIAITIIALYKINYQHEKNKPLIGPPAKALRRFCKFHIPVIAYMLVLYLFIGKQGDSKHMFSILLHFFIFNIIPIWAFYVVFDKIEDFLKVIIIAVLAQSIFIWICITNPAFQITIDALFNYSEMYVYKRDNYAGGLGCITSRGLLRYAVGEVACVFMYYKKNSLIYVAFFLLMALTGTLISRTGLLVAVVCVVFMSLYMVRRVRFSVFVTFFASVLLTIVISDYILASNTSRTFLEGRLTRLINLFDEAEMANDIYDINYFEAYMHDQQTVIPDISTKTMIGTGVPSGTSGNGVYVNVDGGFFRLYVAYGLILAIVFYLFFLFTTLKVCFSFKQKEERYAMLLMLTLIIIGELKEWNIYNSCHVPLFFLMAMLSFQNLRFKTLKK